MTDYLVSRHATVQPTYQTSNEALVANVPLLDRAVNQFNLAPDDREDAHQEAAVAFLAHCPGFDPTRGIPFEGYIWPWVRGAVSHYVRGRATCRDRTVSSETIVGFDPADVDRPFDSIVDQDVARFLKSLDPTDQMLVHRLYWRNESPANIARSMGVTRQTIHVRQRRLLALAKTSIYPAHSAA